MSWRGTSTLLAARFHLPTIDMRPRSAKYAFRSPWWTAGAWLATSRDDMTAAEVVRLYGRRFSIEETFRDTKNIHFGMGLSATHIGDPARRDRLLFIAAFAHVLLTLLGAAGERCGLDRTLKSNTKKTRSLSL